MDFDSEFLEAVLPTAVLDQYLESYGTERGPKSQENSLETLHSLVNIKKQRIMDGSSGKMKDFDLAFLYNTLDKNNLDLSLRVKIIREAVFIIESQSAQLVKLADFLMANLDVVGDPQLHFYVDLLIMVISLCENQSVETCFATDTLHNQLIILLQNGSKAIRNTVAVDLIPHYFRIAAHESKIRLLRRIFQLILESHTDGFDLLCLFYQTFIDISPKELFHHQHYWNYLHAILATHADHLVQKPVLHILSKSVFYLLSTPNFVEFLYYNTLLSNCEKTYRAAQLVKAWTHFFLLWDVSNEKQLHLIEPSLPLLDSIQIIASNFRVVLYKKMLGHTQQSVVYHVANFVLQTKETTLFPQISSELLRSLDRHEYSTNSVRTFDHLASFTATNIQHQNLLLNQSVEDLLKSPVAVWCFYYKVTKSCTINVSLFEKLITKFRNLPNLYIRYGCIEIVTTRFLNQQFEDCSLHDLMRASLVLSEINEGYFESFVESNKDTFISCRKDLIDSSSDLSIKILKVLNLVAYDSIQQILAKQDIETTTSDLIYSQFGDDNIFYLEKRVTSLKQGENVDHLIKLIDDRTWITDSLNTTAKQILKSSDCNDQQAVISFTILNKRSSNCDDIIDLWITKYERGDKISDRVTRSLIELIAESSYNDEVKLKSLFDHIFDHSDSKTVLVILDNVSKILAKFEDKSTFLDRCCREFLGITKVRKTANAFISELFRFGQNIGGFLNEIIERDNFNDILHVVSENVMKSCEFCDDANIVPIIGKLILHGVLINKNDKVEYLTYQEIAKALEGTCSIQNPNLEDLSKRLYAVDAMLRMAQKSRRSGDLFATFFMAEYRKHFNKRYFPDSEIHLRKVRIMQALILLVPYLTQPIRNALVDLLTDSFLQESHQQSMKHLMQLILCQLLQLEPLDFSIDLLKHKLGTFDSQKPSTVAGLIPVLYNLVLSHSDSNELTCGEIVKVILPYAMGAQFKLRLVAQSVLIKLYEQAEEKGFVGFVGQHYTVYDAIREVVDKVPDFSSGENDDFCTYVGHDEGDVFCDIYYTIPRKTNVSPIEWENLEDFDYSKCHCIKFNPKSAHAKIEVPKAPPVENYYTSDNVQKKITPWREDLECKIPEDDESGFNLIVVTSLIDKPSNLGGLSRTCEVFGIKRLVMKTSKIAQDKEFKSLSMSSENWVEMSEVKPEDLRDFICQVKRRGYKVVGAEQTSQSVKLDEFEFPKGTVLILGNEKEGISPELIPLLDYCVEIPQVGMTRSLNVHVAGAIIIWEYYCKHRAV